MSSQQRPAHRNGQHPVPLILFGAFDRHNFGDLLLGRIAARTTGRADAIAAGLAARELRRAGGFAVAALDDIVAAQAGHAFDLLQVGGEILGCSRYEAAVMLLAPDEAARIVARLDRDTTAREHWAAGQPGTARELPYVASRGDVPGVRRILHARIVGEAFARPVVTLLRMPRAGRKQSAYARTWDPDGLNPLALPDTVDAALAAATRQDPALRARHARRLADRAAEAWQWLLAP